MIDSNFPNDVKKYRFSGTIKPRGQGLAFLRHAPESLSPSGIPFAHSDGGFKG
jgi:hypothetical protein